MPSHTRARRGKATEPEAIPQRPCPLCGIMLWGTRAEICIHHTYADENWARGNKVYCDFFHRGIVLPRLPEKTRDEVEWYWTASNDTDFYEA
jgi:hypothetical protein